MLNDVVLRLLCSVQIRFEHLRDDRGQTLGEYSLIITTIAVGLVLLAVLVFRDALGGAFNAATNCLDGSC